MSAPPLPQNKAAKAALAERQYNSGTSFFADSANMLGNIGISDNTNTVTWSQRPSQATYTTASTITTGANT